MIRAKVLGRVKPETIICLNGKYNLYFVEDDKCYAFDRLGSPLENPQVGDIVYFDEWFWSGHIKQLKPILNAVIF